MRVLSFPSPSGWKDQMTACIGRRAFITLIGSAGAWPLTARAQLTRKLPTVGFLNPLSPEASANLVRSFRQGLRETGYVEGENVAIEYGWAEGQFDRLPALATVTHNGVLVPLMW